MMMKAWGFPITGDRVVEALRENFSTNDIWLLLDLDVPSGANSQAILNHLRERMVNSPLEVSTDDLCEALADAPQVWVLDIRLSSDHEVQLYIEDGEVFEENLDSMVRSGNRAGSRDPQLK
ncbi:hypothetical protein [Stenotrophomonas sp. 24(2023)]|uniref:hypothetical protein n=1 Tax=Stenotrophomonas sp. 24(2023) TaxID=3068324 RepID=UPI0027DFEC2C|nr:hypothetical protein [Stenotrophomonas sp. 24(2023)]WMJ68352.1 hypothetical protein Q9R17_14250 [Stenotrophomonas sp. 24(2023)]